jgi:putative YhdH/YhfP family quinone oxidoreductase
MTSFTAFRLFEGDSKSPPTGRFVTMTEDDLSAGDVVVRVAYSSINYKDALAAAGINRIIRDFPRIGGIDLTGCVVRSADARFAVDDPVIVHGFGIGIDRDGGHAEYARVAADSVLKLPDGLSLFDAAVLGAAGYTAALSLHWMEHNGLAPNSGKVLVSGATGGVASVAIDIMSKRGYSVTAMTGKADAFAYLRSLGAQEIISPVEAQASGKPIEPVRWVGAVDSVGGNVLSWILRTTAPEGVVTSFGNAGGSGFDGSVLPFILRGVKLIGINGNSPMPLRQVIWAKLAGDYRPRFLASIANVIPFEQLPAAMEKMRSRMTRGRTIIRMPSELPAAADHCGQ